MRRFMSTSHSIWSSVQKTCASSCAIARTRDQSVQRARRARARWSRPKSANRIGSSRYERFSARYMNVMPGAVHRLDGVADAPSLADWYRRRCLIAVGVGGQEHVLAKIFPMPRGIEQLVRENLRRDHFGEAVARSTAAARNRPARYRSIAPLGRKTDVPGEIGSNKNEPHLAPELAMVPLLRQLDHLQMLFERAPCSRTTVP